MKSFDEIQKGLLKAAGDRYRIQIAADMPKLEFLTTGIRALDRVMNGGFPLGRIVEVYGPYSSGKTLLCQSAVVQVQKAGGVPIYIDREHAYETTFAERQGVDNTKLFYDDSLKTVEDIFNYTMFMIEKIRATDKGIFKPREKKLIAIFIDSIAAANTWKELGRSVKVRDEEGKDVWDKDMGHKAKMIGEGLRKLTGIMDERVLVVIVNQVRSKVGVVYGNPEVTTGGQALPFFTSIRLRLQQGVLPKSKNQKFVKDGGVVTGTRVVAAVTKSRVGPPFRKCELVQSFEFGFLEWPGLFELLVAEGILQDRGKSFAVRGKLYPKGKFTEFANEHPDILALDPVTLERDEGDVEEAEADDSDKD